MSLTDALYFQARKIIDGVTGRGRRPDRFAGCSDMVPEKEKSSTAMHRAFYGNTGALVHKWRNYPAVYDHHLSRFRNTSVRLLEIGVSRGGSMQMWRNYFGPKAVIFGIDINPECIEFNGVAAEVRIGSQTDPMFLKSVVEEMGGVDVVIDDGSHIASHQRASFEALFPLIDEHGVYICEDIHTAYWRGGFEGGFRRKSNFIEFVKRIIDDLHSDFHGKQPTIAGASRTISGIHFYNSVVVLEKSPQPYPMSIAVPAGVKR